MKQSETQTSRCDGYHNVLIVNEATAFPLFMRNKIKFFTLLSTHFYRIKFNEDPLLNGITN